MRLARALLERQAGGVYLFLPGDAAACAQGGQKVPQGYYNIADMLGAVARRGGEIAVCGTCIAADKLIEGAKRGSMDQLAEWTAVADKVLVF